MSHAHANPPRKLVVAEFATTDALLDATTKMRERQRGKLDTHTPYPVHGLSEALGLPPSRVPWIVFGSAMTGSGGGFLMMWWMNAHDYAINVGNRPPFSWPTQIPITFELGVLLGGFGAFFGLLLLMGLPRPYHPVFESEHFRRACVETFFLSVEVPEGRDAHGVAAELRDLGAKTTEVVEDRS